MKSCLRSLRDFVDEGHQDQFGVRIISWLAASACKSSIVNPTAGQRSFTKAGGGRDEGQ
jgi:hypothetical protein